MRQSVQFSSILLKWNSTSNDRQMPWKGERDPYLVWLSEIILQQTRVEQGLPYFMRFKEQYPQVKLLADAPEDDVMRLWQGLGYYSRARNLHATAKHIAYDLKGIFPKTYEEIKTLKGVGPYTAAAIASFVFGERQAVVDGNVIRVLARVYGIDTPFDATAGKKEFTAKAQELISADEPGAYNQAIMDFGATVCTPSNPQCERCPFAAVCVANQGSLQDVLPVREKRIVKKERFFYYLVLKDEKEIIVRKRTDNDIWQGLYELPMMENPKPIRKDLQKKLKEYLGLPCTISSYSKSYTQQLSHQTIQSVFIFLSDIDIQKITHEGWQRISLKNLHSLGFPKVVHLFLQENSLL